MTVKATFPNKKPKLYIDFTSGKSDIRFGSYRESPGSYIDKDGFLKITDRKKQLFKTSGGKYIAPQVIENKMKRSPFIEQIMVIGEGERMPLKYTRSIIDSILDGTMNNAPVLKNKLFGFDVPTECPDVPVSIMIPRNTWSDGDAYDEAERNLAIMFKDNFQKFEEGSTKEILEAGPKIP